MKVLSILLVLVLSFIAAQAQTMVSVKSTKCGDKTFELGTCYSYCGSYAKLEGIGAGNAFAGSVEGYTDSQCTDTDFDFTPIPIACAGGQNVPGFSYTCEFEGSSATSIKSISLAVLFTAAIILSLM